MIQSDWKVLYIGSYSELDRAAVNSTFVVIDVIGLVGTVVCWQETESRQPETFEHPSVSKG